MAGLNVYAFYQYFGFIGVYGQHGTGLFQIFIITGNHHNVVAFLDVELWFETITHTL
jgi:hypothetical protein